MFSVNPSVHAQHAMNVHDTRRPVCNVHNTPVAEEAGELNLLGYQCLGGADGSLSCLS